MSSSASALSDTDSNCSFSVPDVPVAKKRRVRKCTADTIPKSEAPWHRMLEEQAAGKNSIHDEGTKDGRYFRRRFRIPFAMFMTLIQIILEEGWFSGFDELGRGLLDATRDERRRGASLHVKVLSVLRVLGRGNVFDECFDGSGCSESLLASWFHIFLDRFVARLFKCMVCPPATVDELATQMHIYQRLGLNGACGSTDVTHIPLGKCPRNWQNSCTGKEGYPTLAYSVTCSHSRKIYYCSPGFEGSKNDKTISRYDGFINQVKKDALYKSAIWPLNTASGTVQRQGAYLLCDGGYHKWFEMMCGLKHTSSVPHTLWSCQLESVRKDVECCFGILKMRFAILANPLQYHSKTPYEFLSKANNVMHSCCILHNWLLSYDGLDTLWTQEDYLSAWYADPDADLDERYDIFTADHRATVEARAKARKRQFSRHATGARRPGHETAAYEMLVERDAEDDEWEDTHISRREELVKSFMISWDQGKAEWLAFPGTRRRE